MSSKKLYSEIYRIISNSIYGRVVNKVMTDNVANECARSICEKLNVGNYRYIMISICGTVGNVGQCDRKDVKRCADAVYDAIMG